MLNSGETKFALPLNREDLSNSPTQALRLAGRIIPLAGRLEPQSEEALASPFKFQVELL
jgi:hypothetical protein